MVGGELDLESILIDGSLGDVHDGCIVDDDVNSQDIGPGEQLGCGSTNTLLRAQIELESTVGWAREFHLECVDALLNSAGVASSDDDQSG